ncbi:glutaredoxin family protein [Methylophaga sp. OBS4]|uniref:glutaredoxin family protein n=1 Tax=Methylophaga sp. OBS4 TaxID=2991935 RepID=UPI0022527F0D|nr:glutaredoxin family protein [Methylophaga sp. OBS4]MCX4187234.1 glutaredoxin family protein [Methylophaga sp. OBS4]
MQLILFTTAGCHLCELAFELLQDVGQSQPIDIKTVEIGDDDDLVAQYGVLIPVVRFPDGDELNWPFSDQDIVIKINNMA